MIAVSMIANSNAKKIGDQGELDRRRAAAVAAKPLRHLRIENVQTAGDGIAERPQRQRSSAARIAKCDGPSVSGDWPSRDRAVNTA
jgi:hypothetical protein